MGESSVTSSGTKKKKKGFLKSLGRGLSRKKKKQRPDDESIVSVSMDRGASPPPPPPVRGGAPRSSVSFATDVQPIAPSVGGSSSSSVASGGAKPIQVVLLLMDPSSRRFELLQLEFDSNKAMVSDVLRQIQQSATETTLRDMTYVGVSDQTGLEMISHMKLSRFCKGNDIVLAIPSGMTAKATAKLAGPILGDPKVEDMLIPVGAKVIKPAKKSRSAMGGSKLTKISEEDSRVKEKTKSSKGVNGSNEATPMGKSSTSILPTAVLGVIIASLAFFTVQRHLSVTKPLESGNALYPGQWKSQCGIFELLPQNSLSDKLMDQLSSSCDTSSSTMLELGKDGTLRYFTKGGDGRLKEKWKVESEIDGDQCEEEEECDQCGCEDEATFVKEGNNWYVDMDGTRTSLIKDVIRDFMSEN